MKDYNDFSNEELLALCIRIDEVYNNAILRYIRTTYPQYIDIVNYDDISRETLIEVCENINGFMGVKDYFVLDTIDSSGNTISKKAIDFDNYYKLSRETLLEICRISDDIYGDTMYSFIETNDPDLIDIKYSEMNTLTLANLCTGLDKESKIPRSILDNMNTNLSYKNNTF